VRSRTLVRPRVLLDDSIGEAVGAYKVKRWKDTRRTG